MNLQAGMRVTVTVTGKLEQVTDCTVPGQIFIKMMNWHHSILVDRDSVILTEDFIEPDGSVIHPDGTASIPLDVPDDVFLAVAKLAHDRDVTFNEMASVILRQLLEPADTGPQSAVSVNEMDSALV